MVLINVYLFMYNQFFCYFALDYTTREITQMQILNLFVQNIFNIPDESILRQESVDF